MSKATKIKQNVNSGPKVALIYCRVSSERQKTEGHGLESQEHRCREYACSKTYEVDRVFRDSFTGGGDFMDRPAMSELIEYVDKNAHVSYVVIFDDLSRLARDVSSHFNLRQAFSNRGVGIECLSFNFDNSPEGELVETMMAAQHQYHRKNNRRQVVQKQKARLESGYWAFGARKGYKMLPNSLHGKLSTPEYPDATYLKQAMEGFASGTFLRKIDACRFLLEKGFWKKQKAERYIDKFTDLIKDPLYAGYIEYPAWGVERRQGHHEGIISLDTFNQIQDRLKNEGLTKRIRRDINKEFPLRSLIACDVCHRPFTATFSSGRSKKYPYYFCQDKECAGRMFIPRETIESEFKQILKKQSLKKNVDKVVEVIFDRVWNQEVNSIQTQDDLSYKKIKNLHIKIEQLTDLVCESESVELRVVYENKIEKTSKEIRSLEGETTRKLDLSIPYRTALDKSVGLLRSPLKIWVSLDVEEQQKLFYFIFDEKLPYNIERGYRTDKIPSAIRLFEEFVTTNSQHVEMGVMKPRSERFMR